MRMVTPALAAICVIVVRWTPKRSAICFTGIPEA